MIELTSKQLRHAANLKDKIQGLQNELNRLLGSGGGIIGNGKKDGRRRKMSAASKAKLSAKLKAAWARRKATKKK